MKICTITHSTDGNIRVSFGGVSRNFSNAGWLAEAYAELHINTETEIAKLTAKVKAAESVLIAANLTAEERLQRVEKALGYEVPF